MQFLALAVSVVGMRLETRRVVLAVSLAEIIFLGCGGGGGDKVTDDGGSNVTPPAGEFPCDVKKVIEARCQSCHSRPVKFGAPMPIVTWGDTQVQTPSGGGRPVWQEMKRQVMAGRMPQQASPTGPLTPAEKATLLAWLDAGATAGSAACQGPATDGGAGTDTRPGMGTDAAPVAGLPCTPTYRFTAHGATPDAPYTVPQANDTYNCFAFKAPFTAAEQAVAWAPIIDDTRVIHHWILYAHGTTMPTGCSDPNRLFLTGWAPGGGVYQMPGDVGLELPDPGTWLSLEIHYNNKARFTDARDRSGVAICTTPTSRPKTAGVITLGSVNISIPAGAENHVVTSEVSASLTRLFLPVPLHVLTAGPHMHQRGTSLKTDIVRGATTLKLADVPVWDFSNQRAYEHDPDKMTINPGDTLRTTCTYKNDTSATVRYGGATENEMCFNFVMAYPIDVAPTRIWVR